MKRVRSSKRLLWLLLLVGCGQSPAPAVVPSPSPEPSVAPSGPPNYYPLRQDAEYVYYHRENGLLTGTLTLSFRKVALEGDQTVAQVDRKLELSSGTPQTSSDRVLRNPNTIDFASFLDNGSIYNRFVLPLEPGKVWYFATPDAEHRFSVTEITDILTPLRTFRNCVHIVETGENNLVSSETDYWLAPEIGLVRYRFRQTIKGEASPYIEIIDEMQSFK